MLQLQVAVVDGPVQPLDLGLPLQQPLVQGLDLVLEVLGLCIGLGQLLPVVAADLQLLTQGFGLPPLPLQLGSPVLQYFP